VVVRLNLNGLMSLLTRTERSVSFQISFPPLNIHRHYRTTSAIASMPPLAGGRKIRTFIGTIVIKNYRKKSVQKRFVKSRRRRQRRSPLRCMPRSLSICLSWIFIHTHSGFGPSKKESSSSTRGTGTNAIPIPPSTAVSRHVDPDAAVKAAEKAERRQRRKDRREEKAAKRAEKAAHKEQHRRVHNARSHHAESPPRSLTPVHQQRDSRSPSPKRHRSHDIADRDDPHDDRYRRRSRGYHSPDGGRFRDGRSSRSRSPPRRDSRSHSELPPRRPTNPHRKYDEDERESERSRDRQRWDHNTMRQTSVGRGPWGRR
jgi:hypothetical protein